MLTELVQYTATLLGRSAYQYVSASRGERDLDDPDVIRMRANMGGQIQMPTVPQTRWYLAQLEQAEYDADSGNLELAARLMRAARTDGVFGGVLSTRTGGLVRLPKRFRGDKDVVGALELGHELITDGEVRSVFDEMFPPSELAGLAADGVMLGVGVAELVPVEGRDYPVLCRLEPQFLSYDWTSNTWFFNSIAGPIRITPGDGHWILHTPGGRVAPWAAGIWRSVGRAYIRKEHAALHCDNWEGKLANPARVAVMPAGGSEAQADSWFRAVMAWGVNTVFSLRPGYDIRLVESNGRGWEAFNKTIDEQNTEMIIAVAGQTVTTGQDMTGFVNADIHKTIRADLIAATAADLEYTLNTQGIPVFVASRWGEAAINSKQCIVEYDVAPPKDKNAEAQALVTAANAITTLTDALGKYGKQPDVEALCLQFNIPLEREEEEPAAAAPDGAVDPAAVPVAGEETPAADTALNGAQVTSLLQIVGQVAAGQLPRDTGVEIMMVAFNMDRATAERLMGSVGKDFVPTSSSVDVEAVEPEPEDVEPAPDSELELEEAA